MAAEDARRLFESIRAMYQTINNRRPRRVVVHKTTHFTSAEIDGIATALAGVEDVELLQIQQETLWRGIAFDDRSGRASGFPVNRGTVVPLDSGSFLLWTQGNVGGIGAGSRRFYQEQRGIPSPLLVRRFRGSLSLRETATQILQLTKMNWNHHQLYDRLPVTLKFADELADIAKQVRTVWREPYDFRFFM